MIDNYAQHSVALQHLVSVQQALRDKQWNSADRLCADAMLRLARLHGYIANEQRKVLHQ